MDLDSSLSDLGVANRTYIIRIKIIIRFQIRQMKKLDIEVDQVLITYPAIPV